MGKHIRLSIRQDLRSLADQYLQIHLKGSAAVLVSLTSPICKPFLLDPSDISD